jgi:hypothetical protein
MGLSGSGITRWNLHIEVRANGFKTQLADQVSIVAQTIVQNFQMDVGRSGLRF